MFKFLKKIMESDEPIDYKGDPFPYDTKPSLWFTKLPEYVSHEKSEDVNFFVVELSSIPKDIQLEFYNYHKPSPKEELDLANKYVIEPFTPYEYVVYYNELHKTMELSKLYKDAIFKCPHEVIMKKYILKNNIIDIEGKLDNAHIDLLEKINAKKFKSVEEAKEFIELYKAELIKRDEFMNQKPIVVD